MSFAATFKTELLKTKRSAALWFCVLGAGFVPFVMMLSYLFKPEGNIYRLYKNNKNPWVFHIGNLWQAFSIFLLPMFIIIICSLVVQIEYKNNTWKQVFSAPQSYASIFFSKLAAIIVMIVLLLVLFDIFAIGAALVPNLFNRKYGFFEHAFNWSSFLNLNGHTLVACLGIVAIQYFLSLRFKNFIVPIGIGLACLVATLIVIEWEHIFKIPYAHPFLSMHFQEHKKGGLQNHEWNAIGYFLFFTAIGFLDMRYRKARG